MKMNINEQVFWLEGERVSAENLCKLEEVVRKDPTSHLKGVVAFLQDWFSDSPYLTVHTSGSTGVPKALIVRKEQMTHSARLTCEFLCLRQGDNALLCMDLRYIGAMMVVVRALVAGLNLIVRPASGHPLMDVETPLKFTAMVPLQVYNTLQVSEEKERLKRTRILIIGGGAIDATLEREIKELPGIVYSTYGMTETLSHIALRRLNGEPASDRYYPFSSVRLSLSHDNTLVINAPLVCDEELITNDVACIYPDGSFTILGRKDNIINSGGIKIQVEVVEEQIRLLLSVSFAVTSVADEKLGEAAVLLVEPISGEELEVIRTTISDALPKYHNPKYIYVVNQIPMTGNGKIDRKECRLLAKNIIRR